jgi:hypothetical protein
VYVGSSTGDITVIKYTLPIQLPTPTQKPTIPRNAEEDINLYANFHFRLASSIKFESSSRQSALFSKIDTLA